MMRAVEAFGQRIEPVEQRQRALAVGLDDDAETVPAGERRIGEHRRDDIEREVEPIGFLGVDVEAHVGVARRDRETDRAADELLQHPLALDELVARMERRELYRDARIVAHRLRLALRREARDGGGIGLEIALGVGRGARRLAQHVVGVAIAARLRLAGVGDRFVDGAAEDELAAQHPHRLADRGADHRLAEALDRGMERVARLDLGLAEDVGGEAQRPGREIDERRLAGAEMRGPVGRADLVVDQQHRRSVRRARGAAPRRGSSARRPRRSRGRTRRESSPSARAAFALRTASTRSRARSEMVRRAASSRPVSAASRRTRLGSSARIAARISCRCWSSVATR